ncbi:MAG: AI-2E family transporter [Candidatus Saccharimonadales bacterium]
MFHFGHRHDGEKDPSRVEFTVSNETLIRVVLIILITLGLVEAFLKIKTAIVLLLLAFFLSLVLNGPVTWIAGRLPGKIKGNRLIATSISYIVVLILLGGFISYIIPPFVHQTERFIAAAPNLVKETQNQHTALGKFVRKHHLQNQVNNLSSQLSKQLKNIGGVAFDSIIRIAKDVFSLIAVLALTFMMLTEGPRWLNALRRIFVRPKHDEMVTRVAHEMYRVIRGYVNGQVLLAVIAAVLVAPSLFIMGVSYPVALMAIVFISGLIPMLGHTIGAAILTAVALFHSVTAAVVVLIWYVIYINIENYVLSPKIQANTTKMSPLLVLIAIVVGINFGGLLGGLIAIPVAAVIRVAVVEYLEKQNRLPKDYLSDIE